jgi:hypothetical protein
MQRKQVRYAMLALCGGLLATQANASIVLTFFPASDYNANTTAMNATLGITGDTIDNFESTTLIPGLTITLSGNGVNANLTSLPNLFNENTCTGLTQNAAWDGTDTVINIPSNSVSNCSGPANIAQTITFDYAPGTTQFGIGMGNFQSLDSPLFPITNHELLVNGTPVGTIESLAGADWTPGLQRNAYLVITATGGTTITSVGFENLTATASDVLMLDHLAVAPASTVPEPSFAWLTLLGVAAICSCRLPVSKRRSKT